MRRILVAKVAGEGARASNIRSGGKIIQQFGGYRRTPKSRKFKITTVYQVHTSLWCSAMRGCLVWSVVAHLRRSLRPGGGRAGLRVENV